MSKSQISSNKKIRIRFGTLNIGIYENDSHRLVKKEKVVRVSDVVPIVILCENRDFYVRGLGILVETENKKYYTFQLVSLHSYTDPEDVLRLYNFRAIIDYKIYGDILGLIRGWKIHDSEYNRVMFAEGGKYIGSGVLIEKVEFEYRNCEGVKVPLYVYYPNGYEREIKYPTSVQIVPYDPKFKYELIIEPDKEIIEVSDVNIPGFALL